jgi:uncharacterized surface protein with fasciclin (FAS1) repeats
MLQGVAKLKQNPEELDRILKNHIVRGKVLYRNTLYVAASITLSAFLLSYSFFFLWASVSLTNGAV